MHKFIISLILSLIGAVLANSTFAQTIQVIHLGGSSSFREATITAAVNALNSQMGANGKCTGVFFSPGNYGIANSEQSIIYGPTVYGVQTVIEATFLGSEEGLYNLTGGTNNGDQYLSASTYATLATTITPGGGTGSASGGYEITGTPTYEPSLSRPDIILSDVFKSSTPYNIPTIVQAAVGIIPYKWVINGSAPSTIQNMTSQFARLVYTVGSAPVALLTGLNSDESLTILALGRDTASGSRLAAFAETEVGPAAVVNQSYPLNSSNQVVGNSVSGVRSVGPITSSEIVP